MAAARLRGSTVIGRYPPGDGDQSVEDFVNFSATGGTTFDEIVMTSSSPAFETDKPAYLASPEPASILGLGTILLVVGSALRRKGA